MDNSSNFKKKRYIDPELAWLHEERSVVPGETGSGEIQPQEKSLLETLSYGFRSTLAVFLCLIIPVMWYFNWNFSAFANSTSEFVSDLFDDQASVTFQPPAVPVPSPPPAPVQPGVSGVTAAQSLTDYVSAFKQSPYSEKFSMVEVTAFYESELPLSYLDQLNEAGYIDELSFPAIITYHESGVTFEYLDQMKEGGYLERFSYPAIAGFYNSGVTVDFLNELKEKNLLQDLSFTDVLVMFENQ